MTLILNNEEVRKAMDIEACLLAMETAYKELPLGRSVNRPTSHIYTHHSMPDASYSFKSVEGAVEKYGVLALRITSDVVREEHHNGGTRLEKLPLAGGGLYLGLVQLFSLQTGELLGIMPDGVIQQIRVAMTSALGVRVMAREDTATLGLIGTGGQARAHFRLLTGIRPIRTVKVFSPTPEHRKAFVEEMGRVEGVKVEAAVSVSEAIAGCELICTATNSSRPLITGDMLSPGVHLNAIREFEIDESVFNESDVVAIHTQMGAIRHHLPPSVEHLPGLRREKTRDWSVYPEIGDLLTGRVPGRTDQKQITFFLNNIGIGIQFAALGYCVFEAAKKMGLGREVPTEWFLEDVKP